MSVKKNCKFLLILFGLLSLILSFQCSQFSAYATQSKKQNFSTNYTLTGNGGTDMVAIASAQIGKTGKQLGYTEDWCADFVSDCATLAGQSSAIPAHGRADYLDSNILKAGGYKVSKSNAQPGDIAFYDNNYNNSSDHVEIVYQVSGSTVKTFGRNTGSTGSYSTNKVSSPRTYGNILYIIRPNYNNISNNKWYESYSLANLSSNFSAFVSNATTGGYLNNEGWNVAAYPGDKQKQQLWNFNRQPDGSYVITSMLDCNRLSTCDKKYDNRTSIVVTYDDIDDSQKWYIYDAGNKYIFRQIQSEQVMDLDNGGYAKGTNIQVYDFNNTSAQFFKIEKTDWYSALDSFNLGNQFCAYIKNNTTGGYLNNEGWNVAAYSGDESINQKWFFQRQSDGSYIITSILDNAKLTTCDKKSNNGASIVVSHDGVNSAQKWYIYDTNRGYVLRPAHSNRVIDIDNGGYASGTNVQLYEYNCTYAQYYAIDKITVSFDVSFDANGGICDAVYMSIFYGDTYDELENATRKGYNFLGWYTEKEYGDLVTNDTVYKLSNDQTLYAHWEKIIIPGDLNQDGTLSLTDLIPLQQSLLRQTTLTADQAQLADYNSDGSINVLDLMLLKRALLAL